LTRRTAERPNAAWLDERLLLMAGDSLARTASNGSGGSADFMRLGQRELPLEVETLSPSRSENGTPAMRGLIVCRLPSGSIGGRDEDVAVTVNGKTFAVMGEQAGMAPADLSIFLQRELSGLDAETRRADGLDRVGLRSRARRERKHEAVQEPKSHQGRLAGTAAARFRR